MSLVDATEGLFMNLAYGWTFFNPGTQGVLQPRLHGAVRRHLLFHQQDRDLRHLPNGQTRAFPDDRLLGLHNFNINTAGFVIVGMFIVTWAGTMLIWRYAHAEHKWSARLRSWNFLGSDAPDGSVVPLWSESD